jgi:nucleoside-diphosphate-sugar epimerase
MSPLTPYTSAKVLVTGANGFVAMHVVDQLLKAGYVVRGTVRNETKGTHIKRTFAAYGDKLELVVVEDITLVRDNISAGVFLASVVLISAESTGWRI